MQKSARSGFWKDSFTGEYEEAGREEWMQYKKGGTVEWQEVNGRRFWQQVYAAFWQQVFWQAAAVEAEAEAAAPAAK